LARRAQPGDEIGIEKMSELEFFGDVDLSAYQVDGSEAESFSPKKKKKLLIPDVDPREDSHAILYEIIIALRHLTFCKTTIIHNLADGRTVNMYKDKNGKVWYRWKGSSKNFSAYVSLHG
jgi:hypothetical protein